MLKKEEIQRIIQGNKHLKEYPVDAAIPKLAETLGKFGLKCQVVRGVVLIETKFAESTLGPRIFESLEENPAWTDFPASYRGIPDHWWIHARINGKIYTIDTHLMKRLKCFDKNLIPNGIFYGLHPTSGKGRFRHFKRYPL